MPPQSPALLLEQSKAQMHAMQQQPARQQDEAQVEFNQLIVHPQKIMEHMAPQLSETGAWHEAAADQTAAATRLSSLLLPP